MRIFFIVYFISIILFASSNENEKAKLIYSKFLNVCDTITHLQYDVERIDTFSNGKNRVITGQAIIIRKMEDPKFGFYFWGDVKELNWQNIYDGKNNFEIFTNEETVKLVRSVNGAPGHQLVHRIAELVFTPDTRYKEVNIIDESDDTYTLELSYEEFNDGVEDFKKKITISKINYLPKEFLMSGKSFDVNYHHQLILKNLNINENITSTLDKKKLVLQSYNQLPADKEVETISLINTKAPEFLLQNLNDEKVMSEIYKDKLTLVDFWEVWCGACISSMPKVEELHKKYSNNLDVIGILTQDTGTAKKLVTKFGITFKSLIGNEFVHKSYSVNSYPRYFLIDKDGMIKKEYYGFSAQIESDIKEMLK